MTAFKGGLKRIRTAVNGFADHWLSHSPIRPTDLVVSNRGAKITLFYDSANFFKEIIPKIRFYPMIRF